MKIIAVLSFAVFMCCSLQAQQITLSTLICFQTAPMQTLHQDLLSKGWKHKGIDHNDIKKPIKYTMAGNKSHLLFYPYRKSPSRKVKLISADLAYFKDGIVDSLNAYGFTINPDNQPQEGLLTNAAVKYEPSNSTLSFRIMILYFTEHNERSASITLYR